MVQFENIEMLVLIIPVIIAGLFLMKKGARKGLIISRILVAVLLVIALASPFTLVPRVTSDDNPDLVIISDETDSMELFENETSAELYEALTSKTPTSLVKITGESTALGDAIVQYSTGENQIVLVTDGNSNSGEELEDALQFAQETGTTVYLVQPDLEENDLSVQIEGDKTVTYKNENQYEIVVSQAIEEEVSYSYELYSDDTLIRSGRVTQTEREKRIIVPQVTFSKLGAHTLKAVITPSSSDVDDINNVFYKSIYTIPKSDIRTIGLDTDSPLGDILFNLYDVSSSGELNNIDDKKAIVIDNTHANSFTEDEVQELKDYLNDGRGIVVVGGDGSYNFGDYLDSPIEEILPVVSTPTDWSGGRNIVLVLDISQSTSAHQTLDDILGNALFILNNDDLRDAYLGVIAFGSEGMDVSGGLLFLGTASNLEMLEDSIQTLTPGSTSETSLDQGLAIAEEWLEGESGELEIIIISDGGIEQSYDDSLEIAQDIVDRGVNLYYVHIRSSAPSQTDDYAKFYAETLMDEVGGVYFHIDQEERANIQFEDLEPASEEEEETEAGTFPLIEYNTRHFITKNIDVEGSITGYNDVTPKAGADRLIITSTGKPVLTTWRYGLGRVAAFTTDNGQGGDNMWATQMYSGNNSKLISSTVNWVIGNPREETGAVVEAEDTWYGTPVTIELTMYDEGIPTLKLDDDEVDLSLTGTNVYEAVIDPGSIGIHDLSGYPVAVNYALEYRDVGLNEELPSLIKAYGGSTYTVNQARNNLLEEAQGNSEKLVRDSVSQKIYFLLAALIIFLGEVILRRIREIKEMKKLEQEIRT
ncbi:VWA domain-containing protein [Methanolobus profundi]|uniref:von Willebrand factor type A domain-containing protein n=1 Tax=Methanolobus profundi TaxID=487685 RepID=A0A1I4P9Q6_9EURY|nr:VWA domain-containing protein [Methanolobus profundi]SFM24277.1 von Willebrand factor type A domain-containing protein [Methanolobus profundi]